MSKLRMTEICYPEVKSYFIVWNDKREIVVPENLSGKRLDTIVHELLTEFSRSKIQQWINDGHVKVDGQVLLS